MPVTLNIIESTTELGQEVVEIVLASASEPGPAGPGVPTGGTDGQVLTKTSATDYATAWEDPTGGGGGAPTDATYLVTTANGTLSAEVVVGATPGGELGGTWASPTVDATHSGSSHADVQAAAEATAASALTTHTADTTAVHGIADTSALALTANHPSNATFNDHSARHENGGADEISLAGLDGVPTELQAHLDDTADAHDASAISIADAGNDFTATDVEGALAELQADHEADAAALTTHESDTTSVHGITDTSALYRAGGTDVALADGGTGASLADPGADRIVFWDESANAITFLTAGTGLSITNTTIEATGGGGNLADLDDVTGTPDTGEAPVWDGDSFELTNIATQAELDAHTGDTSDAHDASAISFSAAAGIAATDVQAAIEELSADAILDTLIDAKGDLLAGTAADTVARVAVGANGLVVTADSGATPGLAWKYPPGYEFEYQQITSAASITSTNSASPDTAITADAVSFDGSTLVLVEFFTPQLASPGGGASRGIFVQLWDAVDGGAAASIGIIARAFTTANADIRLSTLGWYRITPSAGSHVFSIRASVTAGTGSIGAGAGGSVTEVPAFIRITKV